MSFDRTAFDAHIKALGLKHFTPWELLKPTNNSNRGVKNSPPPRELWDNIVPTIKVVDELRHRLGVPITINSSYRSPAYNRAVGGARASQHLRFNALDIRSAKASPLKIAKELRKMRAEGKFKGGIGLYRTFVHIDTRGKNKNWG